MNKIKLLASGRSSLSIIMLAGLTLMTLLGLPNQAQARTQWTTRGNNVSLNSGNVGIGAATPLAKLDVNGNTNVTGNVNVTGSLNASSQGIAEWMPAARSARRNSGRFRFQRAYRA